MKKMILLSLMLIMTSIDASSQTGTIKNIHVRDDGLHIINMNGSRTTKPACAENFDYWMIKDENSTYGKAQFSMMLPAYMNGKSIRILGADTCTRWGDGEDIASVILE